jgi:two-component system, cell cycle response regulator DivK
VSPARGRRSAQDTTIATNRRRLGRTDFPTVLVVDDDPDARRIFAGYLRSKGSVVFTAGDGRVGVEKSKALGPDVVVMDLAMPRLDGFEAIRRLRASSWTRRLPVVAVSAVPMTQDLAIAAGCDAYLAKPVDPEALWLQIRAILRLRDAPPVS